MDYISTRDAHQIPAKFTDILLGGLAPDGGLYLPQSYPTLAAADLQRFRTALAAEGYPGLAFEVIRLFVDDIPDTDLKAMVFRAYTSPKFASEEIVPVSALGEGIYLGHLSEGPTAAFKDMAMQLLGELFEYELGRRGQTINILGATSGDTGSSAEYAMRGRSGIRVFMLTPAGRMSAFQQAQMFGLEDPNIFNIALDGVFDDCQDVVKAVSSDVQFKQDYRIGAVNSINWARLLAQIVYYISCWAKVTEDNDQQVSFSVPTGNFGDICAGHIARSMGVPIDRLIVATNENDVLDEFFRSGQYRPRPAAETFETSSPSMDISRASNFERFIFDVLDRDAQETAELFGKHVPAGGFSLPADQLETIHHEYGFSSARSTHANRLETIKSIYEDHQVLVDPHTADGIYAAWQAQSGAAAGGHALSTPIICLETALPVKFAETITEAVGFSPEIPQRFAEVHNGVRRVTDLPNDVAAVKDFIVRSIQTVEV